MGNRSQTSQKAQALATNFVRTIRELVVEPRLRQRFGLRLTP